MSSKIAIFIAIFLFFLSWCVPAVDGMVGFGVMVTSILYHFLIVPIPKVFPVWANLTFLLAVGCYFKESEMLETFESKAWMYGIVTCVLMCIGFSTAIIKVNVGAVIWLYSGFFLILALALTKIPPFWDKIGLVLGIGLIVFLSFKLYKNESYVSKYQTGLQEEGLKQYLFRPKNSEYVIPTLTQVQQNNSYRWLNGQKVANDTVDLASLINETIELDFNKTIDVSKSKNKKAECKLKQNNQYALYFPPRYIDNGYSWRRYFNSGNIAVGYPTQHEGTVIYRSKNIDSMHTVIQLIRKADQHILYQQTLLANGGYDGCTYEPKQYEQELNSVFELDSSSLNRKFGSFVSLEKFEAPEKLIEKCEWVNESFNIYIFENKKINFLNKKVFSPQILCSEHYVAVASLTEYRIGEIENTLQVEMFKRDDLQPINCGLLRYGLTKPQTDAFYKRELEIVDLTILSDKLEHAKCPYVELRLSDGHVDKDYNWSEKF